MEVDEALAAVGGLRRWHLSMFTLISLSSFMPQAGLALMFVFIAYTPPHHCKLAAGEYLNETIPEVPGQWDQIWSKCTRYVNHTYNNETMECPNGWTYHTEGENTIVTEWNLVCKYNYLAELSETVAMAGSLVAQITVSVLVDKLGRRYVHISGIVAITVLGTAMSLAPNFTVFLTLRPFAAFALATLLIPGETMLMELFDSKHRAFAGIGLEFIWVFTYMYLALLGYFIREWRTFILVFSLSNIIYLVHIWILPESVWWLTANNRYDEAEKILQNMAKWNKVKVKGRLLKKSSSASAIDKRYVGQRLATSDLSSAPILDPAADTSDFYNEKISDLFTDSILRKHTIISSLMWFACELVYYGIILTTPTLAGDRYLNFFLSGLVELPAYILVMLTIGKGRRLPTTCSFIFAGIMLITTTVIPPVTASGRSLTPLIVTTALLGKFAITASFAIVILYTREIFPTNLRGTASGVCNILGRVGSMGAPFMAYAAKNIPWMPNVTMGSVSIVVGVICLRLPETCHIPLPEKLADIHRLFGKERDNPEAQSNAHISDRAVNNTGKATSP